VPVLPHAQPFQAVGGPTGVLLLHGFTGSPSSMRPWAEHLHATGLTVSVPRLPGHGTTWQQLAATSWQDWYGEAVRAFDDLADRCEEVFVAGLSMGGGLALRLAEQRGTEVAGLLLVNPSVASADRRLVATPLLKHLVRSVNGIASDIKKPGQREDGYDRVPLRALDSLRALWKVTAADLPRVTSPVLLFRSAQDHVVDPSSARLIIARVSSLDVTERILDDSFHVATLDNDAEAIFIESAAFISSRVVARPRDAV
jgi:carboxylesterase